LAGHGYSDAFSHVLEWAQAHLDEELSIECLAHEAAMSPRSFAPRLHATTGTTPDRSVLRQRVLLAQRLLETSDLAVDVIASRCGMAPSTLREHFTRSVGVSPTHHRPTFRRDTA
jgi:transcriptional regulator GlxA family with amidase domain